jgi:hypothetical protein
MSQADLSGPSDSGPASPGSDVADPIRHVGGPWFEVDTPDGPERVRGREAAEQVAESVTSESRTEITDAIMGRRVRQRETVVERFRGPAFKFELSDDPDPDSVRVERHDGNTPYVNVDGRKVTRHAGHFGRGRWTVTYQPL